MTGAALRTPLGCDVETVVTRLCAGERAARVHAEGLVALVPRDPGASRHRRFLGRAGLFAIEVGHEAFRAAGVAAGEGLGIFSAVGGLYPGWEAMVGVLASQRADGEGAWERGFRRLSNSNR